MQHDTHESKPTLADSARNAVDLSKVDTPVDHYPAGMTPRTGRGLRPSLVILAVILVLLVLGGGILLGKNMQKQETGAQATEKPGLSTATHYGSATELINQATTQLAGQQVDIVTMTGIGGTSSNHYSAYQLPAYQVADKKFHVYPAEGTGKAYVGDSLTEQANYTALTTFFSTNKFVQETPTGTPTTAATMTGTTGSATYESRDMLCFVQLTNNPDQSAAANGQTYIASIGCADKSSYQKAADSLQPFYDAGVKAKTLVGSLVLGELKTDKGSDGYQYATIYQPALDTIPTTTSKATTASAPADVVVHYPIGYYYQTPNSTTWTVFVNPEKDAAPTCADFNTDTLRKAFHGLSCLDASQKQSTVQ